MSGGGNILTTERKKSTVIGSGSMGHGATQFLVMNGCEITMVDINDEILQKAKKKIKRAPRKSHGSIR